MTRLKESRPQQNLMQQPTLSFMKGIERKARKGLQVAQRPLWKIKYPELTPESIKQLQAEDAYRRQKMKEHEYELMRDNEPKISPKAHFQAWKTLYEQGKREFQAEISKPAPLVPEKLSFDQTPPPTPAQRKEREEWAVNIMHRQLIMEARREELPLIADHIKKKIWHDTRTEIHPVGQVSENIQKDGTVASRSRFGVSLSSASPRRTDISAPKRELAMGIGYFGSRSAIVPQAQEAVSDEDLKLGVKAYFIRRMVVSENGEKKTELVVIPFAYANAKQTFFEQLYRSIERLAPEKRIPARRARRYQRAQLAA